MTVQIRRTEPTDAQAVQQIYQCENAYTGTLQLPMPTVDMWQKRLANIPEHVYSYVALVNDEVVGNLGFEVCINPRRRHVASLGMGVKDNSQGLGVGSALLSAALDLADNWLNLKRVELTVYIDNDRAIHLYKKFGFEIEGESRGYAFRNGEYVSVFHMARIND